MNVSICKKLPLHVCTANIFHINKSARQSPSKSKYNNKKEKKNYISTGNLCVKMTITMKMFANDDDNKKKTKAR